ncbi:unnamed protein product [Nippostrongylus brasiliensis]|uniref:Integrase catalytic domain-containing protein n=1 Tax=Nippostrongylus brasiliensis TaxID=27835 RepID=A0A0N4XF97_NIPBR|nr:unnamed protein product [Nippostrongylus brasiliensis]
MTDVSTNSLVEKYHACKTVFKNMSTNLRQFLTNDIECKKQIQSKDLAKSCSVKIFGISWDPESDFYSIPCKLCYSENPTKRKVLKVAHSNFDPHAWDDPLSPSHDATWRAICENAKGFIVTFPRAITASGEDDRYELHAFVDASIRAFAAVVYLRSIDKHGTVRSSLLMARQRLAPINSQTKTLIVPRLELLALLIGARLTSFVMEELQLKLERIRIYYSDSKVALHWLQSTHNNGLFVNNRCKEIQRRLTSWISKGIPTYLHYISSELNPADCATRGFNKEELANHMWWTGPKFLVAPLEDFPNMEHFQWNTEIEDAKQQQPSPVNVAIHAIRTCQKSETGNLVLKFLRKTVFEKLRDDSKLLLRENIPELAIIAVNLILCLCNTTDMEIAEKLLIKLMQRKVTTSVIKKWNNFSITKDENGILRCFGRIRSNHLARDTLDTILLLPHHTLTRLVIEHLQISSGH